MKSWLLATRPKTLTAALVPIFAATALVKLHGFEIHWVIAALCLFSALSIQIATNFFNDALDFEKGADTSERIGPTRVTQSGLITQKSVMRAAGLMLIFAFSAGLPLVIWGGWPILLMGLISLFMAYSYTGGPFPLAYLGLGDLFVVIFFGLVAVGGVYFLQTGTYNTEALVLGLQIGCLSTVLIAINNLRDVNQDRLVNKKTLAVRFGKKFARAEIGLLLLTPFLLQVYWYLHSGYRAALLPLIFIPLALKIARQVVENEPSPIYNKFLAQSALLHSGFGLILSLGLYLA